MLLTCCSLAFNVYMVFICSSNSLSPHLYHHIERCIKHLRHFGECLSFKGGTKWCEPCFEHTSRLNLTFCMTAYQDEFVNKKIPNN